MYSHRFMAMHAALDMCTWLKPVNEVMGEGICHMDVSQCGCKGWGDLAADKGNATVVMRREGYNNKLKIMLETFTYQQLRKDPTAGNDSRLSHKLKELERDGEITESLYHRLRPFGSQPPRINPLQDSQNWGPFQTHCFMHMVSILPALQAHHFPDITTGRQDRLACEEL